MKSIEKYVDSSPVLYSSVDLIDDCINKLKRGKAAGHDELTTELLLVIGIIVIVV